MPEDYYSFEEDMQSFVAFSGKIFSDWGEKLISGAFLSGVLLYFNASESLYWILLSLMILDFVFGVLIGARGREGWDFEKVKCGVMKLVATHLYIALMGIATIILQKVGFDTGITPVNVMMGYLSFHEINSIIRNMDILGFKTPPLLRMFIDKSGKKMEKTLENIVHTDEMRDGGFDEGSENSSDKHKF